MQVRRAVDDDLAAVVRLVVGGPVTDAHRTTWAQMMATPGLTVHVAGAPVVGTATVLMMPNLGYDRRPTAFIEALVVDPA